MGALDSPQLVVAESREELERLAQQAAVVIEFDSEAAEQAYREADWRLHLQMCGALGMTAGADRSDGLVHMIEDWWPHQERYMEVDAAAFGPVQVNALRALLQGEFEDWAIHVSIYRGLPNDRAAFVGGLAIYATRTVVQREALHVVI